MDPNAHHTSVPYPPLPPRMMRCPECYAPVPRSGRTCHKCQAQLHYPKRSWLGVACLWAFIGFNAYMVMRLLFAAIQLWGAVTSISARSFAQGNVGIGDPVQDFVNLFVGWIIGAACLFATVLVTKPR